MSRNLIQAIIFVAIGLPCGLLGQVSASGDFGNWMKSYQTNLTTYQSKPCIPSVFPFTVVAGTNLVSGYAGCQALGGSGQSGQAVSQGYLASVIPTPGLTASSTCGTSGI